MTPVEKISGDPSAATTSALLHKRKLSKAPLVATDVRGSERVKATNQGFKQDVCVGKAYFCYDVEAPFLSNKMIRNLGSEFCKISPEVLSEVALRKKHLPKKAVAPVGMQSDKANNKSKKNNDDKPPKRRKN
jgi:hypothetical protein